MRQRTRLQDVAVLAGVSIASASLVLSGHSAGRVSTDTAQRVRQAAKNLGYTPRGFRQNSTTTKKPASKPSSKSSPDFSAVYGLARPPYLFGIITDTAASKPYAVDLIAAAASETAANHDALIITTTNGDSQSAALAVASLKAQNIDYLLIACMKHQPVRLPPGLSCPTVVVNGQLAEQRMDVPSLVPDEFQGAYDATKHLLDLGHQRIAFLNVGGSKWAGSLRLRGFKQALKSAGLPLEAAQVVATEPRPGICDAAARQLLTGANPPTGIFCFNDGIAAGVFRQAYRLGLSIPRDLSVIGFDNLRLIAENTDPGLTTMQLPHRAMMRWAIQYLRNSPPETGISWPMAFRCDLVERNSTGPVPSS